MKGYQPHNYTGIQKVNQVSRQDEQRINKSLQSFHTFEGGTEEQKS